MNSVAFLRICQMKNTNEIYGQRNLGKCKVKTRPPCLSSDIIIILFGPHKGKVHSLSLIYIFDIFLFLIYIGLKYKQYLTFQYIGLKGIIGFRHQIAACEGHSKHRVATYLRICTQYTCHIHQHRAISLFVFYLYLEHTSMYSVH